LAIHLEFAMHGIYRFLKSTLLGGLIVLVPLIAIGAVVVWAGDIAIKAILPVFNWLPDQSVGGVSLAVLMAVGTLLASCFLAGLVAETAIVRGLGDRAERLALFIPGYALMKNVGANLVGIEGKRPVKTVLVRFEASCQLGFLMETLADGRHVVFVPGVPSALVGTLHIFAADRVQMLDMSVSAALDVLSRLGIGLSDAWPKEAAAV
jgi:uncharacterized membrane protein